MKSNKLRVTVIVAKTTKGRVQRFCINVEGLLITICPGTNTTFDPQENKLTITEIRTLHGLQLVKAVVVSLALGMKLVLSESDFDLHPLESH
jgi:hypothetical protein